jgi:hypothetical protein
VYVPRHVELVAAESSHCFIGSRYFLAVDPDFRAVVDTAELHPDLFALVGGRDVKFLAIPPGHSVRAVRRYFFVGELAADPIFDAREIAEVHSEVGILVNAVFDKDGKNSFWRRRSVPAVGRKAGFRNLVRGRGDFCGALHLPALTKDGLRAKRCGKYEGRRDEQGHGYPEPRFCFDTSKAQGLLQAVNHR